MTQLEKLGFETYSHVILSTAHLTRDDARFYLQNPELTSPEIVIPTEYGFIVRLGTEEDIELLKNPDNNLSEGFLSIINMLHKAGVGFITFDADGPVHKLFKTFDW